MSLRNNDGEIARMSPTTNWYRANTNNNGCRDSKSNLEFIACSAIVCNLCCAITLSWLCEFLLQLWICLFDRKFRYKCHVINCQSLQRANMSLCLHSSIPNNQEKHTKCRLCTFTGLFDGSHLQPTVVGQICHSSQICVLDLVIYQCSL